MVDTDELPIPLYHGTSSLFLENIIKCGLGGLNPITEWNVLEFAQQIYPLVERHLSASNDFMVKAQAFRFMVEQKSAAMNFRHGNTYLSPSLITAVRYAANNRYGSELLTYTLDFLGELIRLKVDGVADELYKTYPHIFEKLDVSPAPLLIRVDNIASTALVAEDGTDARPVLKHIYETIRSSPDLFDLLLQQSNFRLRLPIPVTGLKLWFINILRWDPVAPAYALNSLSTRPEAPGCV